MFSWFQRSDLHLKRVTDLLRDAHMNRVEHEAAAEHHFALARMYAARADRLEEELRGSLPELLRTPVQRSDVAYGEIDAQADAVPARPRLSSL